MTFKKNQRFKVDKTAINQEENVSFLDEMRNKDFVVVINTLPDGRFIGDDGWCWSEWMIKTDKKNFLNIE